MDRATTWFIRAPNDTCADAHRQHSIWGLAGRWRCTFPSARLFSAGSTPRTQSHGPPFPQRCCMHCVLTVSELRINVLSLSRAPLLVAFVLLVLATAGLCAQEGPQQHAHHGHTEHNVQGIHRSSRERCTAQSTRAHTAVSCPAERQAKNSQPAAAKELRRFWPLLGSFVAGRRRGKQGEDAGGSWECDLIVSARCGLCGVCGLLCLSPPSSREGSQSRWPVSTRSLWD